MTSVSRYSLDIYRKGREVHQRTAYVLRTYVNISPNSLGRMDKHKIGFAHRQMNPSMMGIIDLLESTKDVGQSGMISPWADLTTMSETNINKYPNIKFDLFKFVQQEFPNPALTFDCDNIVDYNRILDKLVMSAYINLDYKIPESKKGADTDED